MNYIELPVYKNQKKILSALENNQALVVESPTGSGKTTQLPVILYEAGYASGGIIGHAAETHRGCIGQRIHRPSN